MSDEQTGFHYLLIRVDDDGAIHGVDLDDIQVRFSTFFDDTIKVTRGKISVELSGQQVDLIKSWWRDG